MLAAAPTEAAWQRDLLEELTAIPRETATAGERRAAAWVADRLTEAGAREVRLEEEPSNGGYWWPLGLMASLGLVAAWLARRGRRLLAAALGVAASATAVNDLPPRSQRLRSLLPQRRACNVVAELGPEHADSTIVLMAHHDTAHSGWIFSPAIPETIDRRAPAALEKANTSPPLMLPVVGGPAVVAAGALLGSRAIVRAGAILSAGVVATMAEIGSGDAVPGANDNGTGVIALLALARAFAQTPPERTRVLLVSTSEEATCEGMRHFANRHFASLPQESTAFICLDTLGSPHLLVLRGEGMFGIREYPAEMLELLDGLAEELGIYLFPDLRLRNATDGVFPLAAGYRCASIASCTRLKQPANYHWPTDVPENVDYGTVGEAIRLAEAAVRSLDASGLGDAPAR